MDCMESEERLALQREIESLRERVSELEARIAANEALPLHLLDAVHVGILVRTVSGAYSFANRRASEFTGATHEEFLRPPSPDNHPVWRLYDVGGLEIPPEKYPSMEALRTGKPVLGVIVQAIATRTGDSHWLLVDAEPVHDPVTGAPRSIVVTLRDITSQRQSELLIRESEQRSRRLIEAMPIGLAVIEPGTQVITNANHKMCEMLGYSVGKLQGMTLRDITHPDDFVYEVSVTGGVIHGETPSLSIEKRYIRCDGSICWGHLTVSMLALLPGHPPVAVGMVVDITDRKRWEGELRRSEEQFRSIFDATPLGIHMYRMDPDGALLFCGYNKAAERILGVSHQQFMKKNIQEAFPDLKHGEVPDRYREVAKTGEIWRTDQYAYADKQITGIYEVIAFRSAPDQLCALFQDVTERRRAEIALRLSEERLSQLTHHMPVLFDAFDNWGHIVAWNDECELVTGYTAKEMREHPDPMSLLYPDPVYRSDMLSHIETMGLNFRDLETSVTCRDGSVRVIAWSNLSARIPIPGWAAWAIGVDVTARRMAEDAIRHSEEMLNRTGDMARVGGWEYDVPNNKVTWTRATRGIHEVPPGYEPSVEEALKFYAPAHQPLIVGAVARAIAEGVPYDLEIQFVTAKGRKLWVRTKGEPVMDAEGKCVRILGTFHDITGRKEAEETLRESQIRLQLALDAARAGLWVWELESGRLEWDDRAYEVFGLIREQFDGHSETWMKRIHPDDYEAVSASITSALREGERFELEFRMASNNGEWRHVNSQAVILRDQEGKPLRAVGMCTDATARVRAEAERRAYEAQIQHAQKLESLGVLAGGIAHDFNNLLMAILGNADLALRDLSPVNPALESVLEIERAARRAADLCKQMLAYSGKGRFYVVALDVNEVVTEMAHLLEVSISKKAILRYNLAARLPAVNADATQIRQVVMNLITNASDAIGDKSGVIMITTGAMDCDRSYLSETYLDEELPEGVYVYVEVADTGCGMDDVTRQRIFEPFYTTKFTGRGLGLSAVIGIVRSHKGALKIYSEPGKGSTFKLLLPACDSEPSAPGEEKLENTSWRGSGVILLVDDEDTVRALGKRMLERHGFQVITAAHGGEAIDAFRESGGEIVCVLLDLTMPHMDGEETFRELRRIRKDVKVIMTSGYNDQEIMQRFAGKGLAGIIQKPYQSALLIQTLQHVLEEKE